MNKKLIYKIVTALMVVTVLVCAGYIMINQLGLVDGYDFGVGAYYYADIPEFQKYLPTDAYQTTTPLWVHFALFIAWGWIIWRLWHWIDKKIDD